ncbi:MAG: ABC transporter permease [Stellaceae bacterium]
MQSVMEPWRIQVRVISALVRRETRAHFGEYRLGYLWAVIEPGAHLAALVILFIYILHRHIPVPGSSMLFFLTGLVPWFVCYKIAVYLTASIAGNRSLLQLPLVKPLDVAISRAILEAATYIVVAFLFFGMLYASGNDAAIPQDPFAVAGAVIVLVTLGFGIGLINTVIYSVFAQWSFLFSTIFGPLYLLSGIFFLVDEIPQPFRDYLLFNPILHLIVWFRMGFYPTYPHAYLDRGYAVWCAVGALVLGLGLFRISIRKLLTPK